LTPRVELNPNRLNHVKKVFQAIDFNNKGYVTKEDLWTWFQGQNFDEVKLKLKTKEQLFEELIKEMGLGTKNQLSLEDWINFYTDFG
jgi:Ca2+-binding EF-hand superfamily protein